MQPHHPSTDRSPIALRWLCLSALVLALVVLAWVMMTTPETGGESARPAPAAVSAGWPLDIAG